MVPVTARPSGVVLKYARPPERMWKAPQAIAARPSSTSSRRQSTARAISAPYSQRPDGDAGDVGLVVLADVGGVGARDRALVAHPGHGDGRVEAAGEGDADALTLGEGGEDLGHLVVPFGECGELLGEGVAARRGRDRSPARCRRRRCSRARRAARPCRSRWRGTARRPEACGGRRGWRWPRRSRAARRTAGPAGGTTRRSRRGPASGRRPRRVRRRRATPDARRTLTASSSTRSRLSVAWVTCTPLPPSSSASSVWECTSRLPSRSVISCWRAFLVSGVRACSVMAPCSLSSQARIAFWACRRFSASSHTTLCGPSITSAAISEPR